jgi:hypothetical protein
MTASTCQTQFSIPLGEQDLTKGRYGALSARVSAVDIVQLVITTFTEQENAGSKTGCKLLKAGMQSLVNMVIDAIFTALTTEGLLAGTVTAKFPVLEGLDWVKFGVQQSIRFHNDQVSQYETGPLITDICERFGGSYEAHNEEHAMQLRLMFDSMVSSFRETLSQTTESFNRGAFDSEDPKAPSQLARMMFDSPWINETVIHDVLQNPMTMEK